MTNDRLLLEVRVTVRQPGYPGLEVHETAELERSFLEVAKVLGQFHHLVQALQREEA